MKVKELLKNYKGYKVIEMGYPGCMPFTCLPKELQGLWGKEFAKAVGECEVKGYCVSNYEHTDISITHCLFGGKKRPNLHYKGTIEIYLIKGEKNNEN